MKVAVVYWSGTGNTEAMAEAVASGAREAGAEVKVFGASEFNNTLAADFESIAFGCPSMGAEELEDSEFQPMFDSVVGVLSEKRIALFGSYGWGDGQWIRDWEDVCKNAGAVLVCESVIANDAPDDEAVRSCQELGSALV